MTWNQNVSELVTRFFRRWNSNIKITKSRRADNSAGHDVPTIDPELLAPSVKTITEVHFDPTKVHHHDLELFSKLSSSLPATLTPIFLDGGGNIWNTIASLKALKCSFPVFSFEINPALHKQLNYAAQIYGNARVFPCGLGAEEQNTWLYIPVLGDFFVLGESTINLNYLFEESTIARLWSYFPDKVIGIVKIPVVIRSLDSFNLAPSFIKINVEGAEEQVLLGAKNTIQKHSPLIMTENSYPDKVESVLSPFGYEPYTYDQNSGLLSYGLHGAQNAFWLRPPWQSYLLGGNFLKA